MATGNNVLKEFLVAIGFKIDETDYRKFQAHIEAFGKQFVDVGRQVGEATILIGGFVERTASNLEKLYFASQRLGTSAGNVKTFGLAAQNAGLEAGAFQAAAENFAQVLRTQPGANMVLFGLGVADQKDKMAELQDLIHQLKGLEVKLGPQFGHATAAQYANIFGIDEQTLFMLEKNLDEFDKTKATQDKFLNSVGLTRKQYDAMALSSHLFMDNVRATQFHFGVLEDTLGTKLQPIFNRIVADVDEFIKLLLNPKVQHFLDVAVDDFLKVDDALHGWLTKALAIAAAFTAIKTGFGVLKFIGNIGKLGAGAEVAEGAEGAAAVAGGALGWPALIAAAVAAAIVYMTVHPDQVRKAVGAAWDFTKKEATKAGHAIATEAKHLPAQTKNAIEKTKEAAKAVGGWDSLGKIVGQTVLNSVLGSAGNTDRLTNFLTRVEGHAKNGFGKYKDIAGVETIGFGHRVRQGEIFASDFGKTDAYNLLQKDINEARKAVDRLVKIKLTTGQRDALTDFDFQFGEGKFANSTLLKDLNAGNIQKALIDLEQWNKVKVGKDYVYNSGIAHRRAEEAAMFSQDSQPVTINQDNHFEIHGTDPRGTADAVASNQGRVNGDLLRNMKGAVQ